MSDSVAIRLGITGGAEARRELKSFGNEADAQMSRYARAAEKASDEITAAEQRRARAAEKIAALIPQTSTQQAYQAGASTNYGGESAREAAAAFRDLLAEEDRLDAKARALTTTMEPLRAAQARYNAEVADLVKLQDSGRISLDQFLAEEAKAAAVLERVSGSARTATEATQALNAAQGGGGPDTLHIGKSAQESADAFRELLPLQEQQQARVEALRARIDPLYTAQKRYDDEIRVAKQLLADKAIGDDEYAKAVRTSEAALDDARAALDKHTRSGGLNFMQMQMLKSAAFNSYQSFAAGMPIMRIVAEQGAEVAQAFVGVGHGAKEGGEAARDGAQETSKASEAAGKALDELGTRGEEAGKKLVEEHGVGGAMTKLRALLTPTRLAIGGTALAVALAAKSWYDYSSAVDKLNALAQGSGRLLGESGAQLEANAASAARAGNITVGAARDIEAGYLGIARSGDVLTGLTAITTDFAAATGGDAKSATQELGAAFQDPIQGAQDLAAKYGVLTAAQVDHIAQMVEEGRETDAQRLLLDALKGAFDGAADHATGLALAWKNISSEAAGAWEWMGKALNRYGTVALLGASPNTGWLFEQPGSKGGRTVSPAEAAANAARAKAQSVADGYTGAGVQDGYRRNIGTLTQALKAGGTAEQVQGWTQALDANRHALDTWVPAQQKANDVAAAQAKVAQAKTPAAKRAAAEQLALAQAQGEVATKSDILARAHSKADAAAAHAGHTGDKHAQTLAREAESMEVAARGSLTLADAYLRGGAAAIEAEARKKAATDATKKGIDVEAQARRQLDVEIGDRIVTGAKATTQLGDETRARAAANDNMAAGKLAAAGLNQALSDEAALRPLLVLRALAHGDALEKLNQVIERYRANLKAAHDEDGRSEARVAIAGFDDAVREAQADQRYVGDTSGRRDRSAGRRAAERYTRDKGIAGTDDGNEYEAQAVGKVDAELTRARADSAESTRKAQADQLVITQAEIGLIGKSADEHDRVIGRLQLQLQLATQLGDEYDTFAPAIMAQADATELAREKLQHLSNDWAEVKQTGEQFIDDLTNPDGSGLKSLLKDVEAEFIKLAALNPLKNLLFGEKNPTLGGALGSLFGALGGGKSNFTVDPAIASFAGTTTIHNASGTEDFSGGRTWLNENGPEILDLPGGTRVIPAGLSRQMVANDNARGDVHQHFYLDGAVVDQSLYGRMEMIGESAAVRGAAGGAQISKADAAAAGARRLGRWR